MTVQAMYEFHCDAPGCNETIHVTGNLGEVKNWGDMELEEGEVHGCCKAHLAAAVLDKLEFHDEAVALVHWASETKQEVKDEAKG